MNPCAFVSASAPAFPAAARLSHCSLRPTQSLACATAAAPLNPPPTPSPPASAAITRIPSTASPSFSDVIVHQSTVQVAPLTAAGAGSNVSDQLSAILATLEARLLAAGSNPALLLTISVHLTSSVSADDFYRAWAAHPTFTDTSPILSLVRISELVPDTRASVSVSATAALADPEPTPVGIIATDKAAAAVGAYSQAIAAPDGTVYVSGCIGLTTGSDPVLAGPTVEQQTAQALNNLRAILAEAGCQPDDIVKTVILLDSMKDFAIVNEQYKAFFDGGRVPARSCFAADALPKGALVEIEAIAKQKTQL